MASQGHPDHRVEDQRPVLYGISISFCILSLVVVSLRFLARRVTHQPTWWDDWLLVGSTLGFVLYAIHHGGGRHVWDIPPEDVPNFVKGEYGSAVCYPVNITCVRCSILCLYLRIFGVRETFRKLCVGMLFFCLAWFTAIEIATIFHCRPVEAFWNRHMEGASCFDLQSWLVGSETPNILSNVVIIIMPMPLILGLQLSVKHKVALCGLFLLAFSTTILSILRAVAISNSDPDDVTWSDTSVAVFLVIEENFGTICACLPIVAPLARIWLNKPAAVTHLQSMPRPSTGYPPDGSDSAREILGRKRYRRFDRDRISGGTIISQGRCQSDDGHRSFAPDTESDKENLWSPASSEGPRSPVGGGRPGPNTIIRMDEIRITTHSHEGEEKELTSPMSVVIAESLSIRNTIIRTDEVQVTTEPREEIAKTA